MSEHDVEHIWLRQSVTFSSDGQTRTLEIAVPVPRGCTSAELDALLAEAEAGMARLSHLLDARVAGQAAAATTMPASAAPAVASTPIESVSHPSATPAEAPTTPVRPAATPAAAIAERTPANRPTATSEGPQLTPPSPSRTAAQPALAAQPRPALAAQPRPALARPGPVAATADRGPATGPAMSIPDFLAAAAELGLNPRQAMESLGVRSLSGLNLREALATLRRQLLREEPPVSSSPASASPPAPEIAPATAPAAASHYFEEEEDNFTFGLGEDDDLADEEEGALAEPPASAGMDRADADGEPSPLEDNDPDPLADVPDFEELAPPLPEPAPAPARPAPRATGARNAADSSAAEGAPASGPLSAREHNRALQRIGQLRAVQPGAPATPYQRNAFKNTVVSQLSETEASALARALWRASPAQLSGDQLDALIRWAKDDDFEEEARLVLEALRAEQARASHSEAAVRETGPSPLRRATSTRSQPPGGR